MNNDGNDELGIGAYAYDQSQTNEGAVFFFYGRTGALSTTPDWSYLWGSRLCAIWIQYELCKKIK